jgi:hypothetical protein
MSQHLIELVTPIPRSTRARRAHESTLKNWKNEVTTTLENLFVESLTHRALLFDALHRATKQADESRQDAPTALPVVAAPSIAPDIVAPLREAPSALSNAIALGAAVALAVVAAFFSGRRHGIRGEHGGRETRYSGLVGGQLVGRAVETSDSAGGAVDGPGIG